jgi:hypothetical protein
MKHATRFNLTRRQACPHSAIGIRPAPIADCHEHPHRTLIAAPRFRRDQRFPDQVTDGL